MGKNFNYNKLYYFYKKELIMKKIYCILILVLISFSISVNAISINGKTYEIMHSRDEYELLIITTDFFVQTVETLVIHKNNNNINTIVKTTDEIYSEMQIGRDHPEKIKYYIKQAIETVNISYVLFVGGAQFIPVRYTHIFFEYDYQTEWVFVSDLYYADIYNENGSFSSWDTNDNDIFGELNWYGQNDFVDLKPDVYLGRLTCVSIDELSTCINKIISYENEPGYAQEWFKNIVVIGGDSLLGDEEHVDEGEYVNQKVIDNMPGFIPKKVWASNGGLNNPYNINNAINDGAGFVFFNGHGHLDVWATHPHESPIWVPPGNYQNSHVDQLNNVNKYPIIISDACYHCTFDIATDCFGWNFITNPNGGCIAFLGSTDIDVSYGGVDIVTKGIEKLCIEMSQNFMNGDETFGELWSHAIHSYLSTAEMDEIDYITIEEFQPFGDPSLRVKGYSQPPNKPLKPVGEINGKVGVEYNFSSYTIDPDEDKIYYLFNWGDDHDSGWLGPYNSGETVKASHNYLSRGNYEIRVIAKDENDAVSEWSEPLTVTMIRNRGIILSIFEQLIQRFPLFKTIFNL
jgi:hypothetical protein